MQSIISLIMSEVVSTFVSKSLISYSSSSKQNSSNATPKSNKQVHITKPMTILAATHLLHLAPQLAYFRAAQCSPPFPQAYPVFLASSPSSARFSSSAQDMGRYSACRALEDDRSSPSVTVERLGGLQTL